MESRSSETRVYNRAMRTTLQSRLIALGEWLFRHRSWTPIPFILVLILCRAKESPDAITWWPGLALLVAGEGLRLWGVAVVGKGSRTRGSGVARLVTTGPYAYVRNPLYLGNFLLTLGATFISELLWMLPVVITLYLLQYVPIVLWEEQVLSERFGAQYAAYCRDVPRWIPRWRPHPSRAATPTYQWRSALWSERSTFGSIAVLLAVMVVKENLAHLPKFLHKHAVSRASHAALPRS